MNRKNLTPQHVFSALCVAEHVQYTRDRDDKTERNPWSEYEGRNGSINLKDLIAALGVAIDDQYHNYRGDAKTGVVGVFEGVAYDYEVVPAIVDALGAKYLPSRASLLELFVHGDRVISRDCHKAHTSIERCITVTLGEIARRNMGDHRMKEHDHVNALATLIGIDAAATASTPLEHAVGGYLIWGYWESEYYGEPVVLLGEGIK